MVGDPSPGPLPAQSGDSSGLVPSDRNGLVSETAPALLVVIAVAYLLLLLTIGATYFAWSPLQTALPSTFGPIPIAVPWWGAVGAVVGSLYGIFFHNKSWDPSYDVWHYSRPLVGARLDALIESA